jgi:outer membrane protein OmpA-like peptidoglycan-associated protein
MVSKKYIFLAGIFCLLASYSFAQAGSYDVTDSSVVPSKRMPQHTEFLNGTYNFPAKPRNQWEIGIKYGLFQISGDVPATFLTAPNFGAHIRKAFGYVFSMRLEYMYGTGKGLDWLANENYGKNTAWTDNGYAAPVRLNSGELSYTRPGALEGEEVYYNYKTRVQDLSLQGVVTLNNIRFHKSKTGVNFYLFGGVGGTIYDVRVNAKNENDQRYDFSTISGGVYDNRKDTRDALKDLLDDTYESAGESQGARRPRLFGDTFKPTGTVGVGMAFKLSNKFNLAIEDRITMTGDDLFDGQRWQEHAAGDAVLTRNFDTYNFMSLGLNYNLGSKSVEPLWWLNPLDYAYQEIRKPKNMILPKPVLPDSDGDGVTDQFDREQTPAGVPVDTHGVSLDTDGDGVPDAKDKELVTPTYCQPVDADGVGKCPCPAEECFEKYVKAGTANDCATTLGALPSISFKSGSNQLDADAKAVLATVATRLRNSPECKVVVAGYGSSTKKEQQLSWDHVNKVITYLVEQEGISSDRFIFKYGEDGPVDTVDLRGATSGEEGPNTVAPPHPNLRKK